MTTATKRPSYSKMLIELAREYGVTKQSDWTVQKLSSEIKTAAKRPLDSIEQIYDDYASGGAKPATAPAKKPDVGKVVEVIPPGKSETTVNVETPQPIVNVALPAVTIRQGEAKTDKPWADYALAAGRWLQPFALGAMTWATFGAAIKRMIGG